MSPRNDLLFSRDHPEVASDIQRRRLRRQKCLLGTTPSSLIDLLMAHQSTDRWWASMRVTTCEMFVFSPPAESGSLDFRKVQLFFFLLPSSSSYSSSAPLPACRDWAKIAFICVYGIFYFTLIYNKYIIYLYRLCYIYYFIYYSSGCSGPRLDPNIESQNRFQKGCQIECQNICELELGCQKEC